MDLKSRISDKIYPFVAGYFKCWANISLKRWHPRIIMITGSAGKTTMLNLIETQLGKQAHYSHNANSAFGIAFDILGEHGVTGSKMQWVKLIFKCPFRAFTFRHKQKYYIVETDGDYPCRAEFISKWLKPEVSLWVSLGRSHAMCFDEVVKKGKFKTLDEAIAHEFATIPQNTKKLVLIDGDNETMVEKTEGIKAEVVKLSRSELKSYKVQPDRAVFTFTKRKFTFHDPMPRDVTIQLLMLEKLMGYLDVKINYNLSNYATPPGRNNYFNGKNGLKLIDSSYNAHIISMQTMLNTFKEMDVPHKWIVVGDIIDQGSVEKEEHEYLAELLADAKVDQIILVGRRTTKYTYPILQKKKGVHAMTFRKPDAALKYLEKNLKGNETVLFKGSQYLEWIIEKLLDNPEDAKKLPRQTPLYKKRRAQWGLN